MRTARFGLTVLACAVFGFGCSGDGITPPPPPPPKCTYSGLTDLLASDPNCKPPIVKTLDTVRVTVALADSIDYPRSGMIAKASWVKDGVLGSTQAPISIQFADIRLEVPVGRDSITLEVSGDDRQWPVSRRVANTCYTGFVQTLLLVPKKWLVTSGRFAGKTIDVPAEAALQIAGPDDPLSFYRVVMLNGPQGCGRPANILSWRTSTFPIPLALNHTLSYSGLSMEDSVRFYRFIDEFNINLMGRQFFKASRMSVEIEADGTASLVLLNTSNVAANASPTGSISSGDAQRGRVTIESLLFLEESNREAVYHELVHLLGFGHTRGWRTGMCSARQEAAKLCAAMNAGAITETDVGMIDLALNLRERSRKFVDGYTLYGFLATYQSNFNSSFSP